MKLSRKDFDWAAQQQLITEPQAEALWQAFSQRHPDDRFDFANVAYYTGALIVIAAMGWFLSVAWQLLGGLGILGIACAYALAFGGLGAHLWFKENLKVAGGLLFSLMVCMTPLAVYGLLLTLGMDSPDHDPFSSESHTDTIMAVSTIITASITLFFVRFPFLTAPIAFSLWYLVIAVLPQLLGNVEFSWAETQQLSMYLGLLMLLIAYFIDRRTEADFAFWLYLFGMLAFWGNFSLLHMDTALYLVVNLGLMMISVLLQRRIVILFGSIGVLSYLGYLAYDVFADSFLFPVILSLAGILVIFLGLQYQRHHRHLEQSILSHIPSGIQGLLPRYRQQAREMA